MRGQPVSPFLALLTISVTLYSLSLSLSLSLSRSRPFSSPLFLSLSCQQTSGLCFAILGDNVTRAAPCGYWGMQCVPSWHKPTAYTRRLAMQTVDASTGQHAIGRGEKVHPTHCLQRPGLTQTDNFSDLLAVVEFLEETTLQPAFDHHSMSSSCTCTALGGGVRRVT